MMGVPMAVIFLFSPKLLALLNQDASTIQIVDDFSIGFWWGVPAFVLIAHQQQFLFGIMRPYMALAIAAVYFILRLAFSWALATGFGGAITPMGAQGFGYAFSISSWLQFFANNFVLFMPSFK